MGRSLNTSKGVSIRFNPKTIEELNKIAEERGYTDRASLIREIVEEYLKTDSLTERVKAAVIDELFTNPDLRRILYKDLLTDTEVLEQLGRAVSKMVKLSYKDPDSE